MTDHRLPEHIAGYRKGDSVYTALGRPAIITSLREDGKLNARYVDGQNRWASLTTLDPRHLKHRPT